MTLRYVVHDGPQGSGDGSSVANGMALQTALTATNTAGDEVRICATGTYTVAAAMTLGGSGTVASPILITGANASGTVDGTRPTLDRGGNNGFSSTVNYYVVRHIDFTSNTGNARNVIAAAVKYWVIENCSETSLGTGGGFITAGVSLIVRNCTASGKSGSAMIANITGVLENVTVNGAGIGFDAGSSIRKAVVFKNCVAYDCGVGFSTSATSSAGVTLDNCLAYECTSGLVFSTTAATNDDSSSLITNSTFADCTNGVLTDDSFRAVLFENCIFANNTTGINNATAFQGAPDYFLTRCAFHNNSTDIAIGSVPSDCETAADPAFVDDTNVTLSSRNYALGSSSTLRNVSFTGLGPNFTTYPDRGYIQSQSSGGGTVNLLRGKVG
jgi:hypothetical protein